MKKLIELFREDLISFKDARVNSKFYNRNTRSILLKLFIYIVFLSLDIKVLFKLFYISIGMFRIYRNFNQGVLKWKCIKLLKNKILDL